MQRRTATVLPPNNENIVEKCTLRTYRPAILNFEMSAEEEDVMEWVHLEPPEPLKYQNVKCKNSTQKNNEKKDSKTIIKALRIENLNLRQKIRRLKYQLRCMAQKESNQKKQKKEMLKNLINKQELK